MNETILVIVFIVIYFVLLSLCIMKLINSKNNDKKLTKIILIISTIVFVIGIILYATGITPHEWVKMLNTSNWENDPEMEEYIEANKVLINLKYYVGIILIITSYIGNIIAMVKNNKN